MNARISLLLFALVSALFAASCSSSSVHHQPKKSGPTYVSTGKASSGKASWYCIRSNGGRHTASGEPLSDDAHTAAHKTLPMGTRVRVTNLKNGRSEVVRITDRGPYTRGRIIDVTKGVAQKLDMITSGVAPVKVEVLQQQG